MNRDDDITIWDCPKCPDGKLIKRTNRRDGSRFLGCTNFPKCRYVSELEKTEDEEGNE